jgi:ATP-dependent protease ClpP protease subunit
VAPNINFRENAVRSIYVCEEITFDLLKKLTPRITELRLASLDPITVYLDSQGGDTRVAQMLLRLLKAPNQDGRRCNIVTVATNYVASAAADILIGGDYSLAYGHATVHYHGTRTGGDGITDEQARMIAAELNRTNEYYANKVARIILSNFAFLRTAFEEEIRNCPDKHEAGYFTSAVELACFIKSRLSVRNRPIIDDAIAEIQKLAALFPLLEDIKRDIKGSEFEIDLATLLGVIEFERKIVAQNASARVDSTFLSAVEKSYNVYKKNTEILGTPAYYRIFRTIGPLLLSRDKASEFSKLPEEQCRAFLTEHAFSEFDRLYTLALTIGYRLQRGENLLTAKDAYMLGMVNEIVGSQLPCLRLAREHANSPPGEVQLPLTPSE